MLRSLLLGRWLNNRNEHSALLQHLPGTQLRIAALSIEYDVDIVRYIFEFRFRIIYGLIDTQLPKERLIASRSCPDDVRAFGLLELDGKDS